MFFYIYKANLIGIMVCLSQLIWLLCGCSVVGPTAISRGRPDYNEVITQTDKQQMLMTIVRNRYGETSSMLTVTNVTANVRIAASAGINIGVGPSESYDANLVPFSSGLTYEENPTISYTPVQGEQYIRKLMSPIPLDLLILITRSVTQPALPFKMLVNRVNDVRNPDFLGPSSQKPDHRFDRFIMLMTDLGEAGVLDHVNDPRKGIEFAIAIRNYATTYLNEVKELLSLLSLPIPNDESADIILPVSLAITGRESGGIAITTRSIYDLIEIMSASIEIPNDHADSALAVRYPQKGLVGEKIRIQVSKKKPRNALVRVKYRGWWFYIDETNHSTKLIFRLILTLWSARVVEDGTPNQVAPILTAPVSR